MKFKGFEDDTETRAAFQSEITLDISILEETEPTGNEEEKGLRGAINECLWKKLNRSLLEYAESRTLSDIMQECTERTGDWDMYVI